MTGSAFRKPRLAGGDQVCNQNQLSPYLEAPLRGFNSLLKFAFIAGLTFLVAAEVAYGQAQAPNYGTNDPGIQQRMQNQEQRIDQGVKSGALTPKEAGRLETEQTKIQQTEQRMKSDGKLTPKERQKLQNMQDRSSQHIYNQKHDAQTANVARTAVRQPATGQIPVSRSA